MYNFLYFQVHGAADHGGGVAGMVAHFLSFLESLVAKSPGEIFATVFPGMTAIANIHPLLVHFPIAFLSVFLAVDLSAVVAGKREWRRLAGGLLYLGTITAAFTVAAGLLAAETVAHGEEVHDIMESHEHFGISVLVMASLLSLWRLRWGHSLRGAVNTLYLVVASVMVAIMILGADLGGLMVYGHGVAVKAVPQPEQGHGHVH